MSSVKRRKVNIPDAALSESQASSSSSSSKKTNNDDDDNNNNQAAVVDLTVQPDHHLEGIPYLVLVKLQSDDPEEVVTALEQLHVDFIISYDEKNMKDFIWTGTPAMIVLAMQKWTTNEIIQDLCCHCLKELIDEAKPYKDYVTACCSIVRCGGVDAIISALKAYPDAIDVCDEDGFWWGDGINIQGHGIAILGMLYDQISRKPSSPEPILLQSARRFVYELDGLQLVHETMKKFENWEVRFYGCRLLSNLSTQKEFRKSLMKCIPSVAMSIQSICRYAENEDSWGLEEAHKFMRNISTSEDSDDNDDDDDNDNDE